MRRRIVGGLIVFLLVSGLGAASWVEGAFNPADVAQRSDTVVHGVVTETTASTVTINVTDVFKGDTDNPITVQLRGGAGADVSTAASFSAGEEVVVMLQQINGTVQVTSGQPGKYLVENGTVAIREPEQKRITVGQLRDIVQEPETTNITAIPSAEISGEDGNGQSETAQDPDSGFLNGIVEFLSSLLAF